MLQPTQPLGVHALSEDTCGVSFDLKADPLGKRTSSDLFESVQQIRNHRKQAMEEDWDKLILRFLEIADSGKQGLFPGAGEKTDRKNHWRAAHLLICELLGKALADDDDLSWRLASKHDREILEILWYMLGYAYGDPRLHGPGPETAPGSSAGRAAEVSSTLRGCILDVMWGLLLRRDGLSPADPTRAEIKDLFRVLARRERDDSIAFQVGHHFPTYYWRDKEFGHEMLPVVFPEDKAKESLYIAAWTGYLARPPSEKMLADPAIEKLYRRGLALDKNVNKPYDPVYHDDFESGIATNLATAHMRFEKFDLESDLMNDFFQKGNATQLAKFIDHIGRETIMIWPKGANHMRERLPKTWRWILRNHKSSDTLKHLGWWINANNGLYDTAELAQLTLETLEKTKGRLDWVYGLVGSMSQFKEHMPETAADIRSKLKTRVDPQLWEDLPPRTPASPDGGSADRRESRTAHGRKVRARVAE